MSSFHAHVLWLKIRRDISPVKICTKKQVVPAAHQASSPDFQGQKEKFD